MEDPLPLPQQPYPHDDFSQIPLDDPSVMISDDLFDFDFSIEDVAFADALLNDPFPPDPTPIINNNILITNPDEINTYHSPSSSSPEIKNPVPLSGAVSSEDSNCKASSGISHNDSSSQAKNIKSENDSNNNNKRKKVVGEEEGESKLRKGLDDDDEEEKKRARLMRNRESAQLSRQRKKQYVEELEDKVKALTSTISDLNARISFVVAENVSLRQQLHTAGPTTPSPTPVGPTAVPPMYPPPPPPYVYGYGYNPWVVGGGGYVVKGQGAPLVPIPRLKQTQQQPRKEKKEKEKEKERKKTKTKKVASVSLLGLLFFFLLFGGLVPLVSVRYNGGGGGGGVVVVGQRQGRVVSGTGNSSEGMVASLYVPRNDKMVKIDGNLIIHSVLAVEKGKGDGKGEGTSLAIANYPPYPRQLDGSGSGSGSGRQRALGSSENLKSPVGAEGSLQQWFREGLAGIDDDNVCCEL